MWCRWRMEEHGEVRVKGHEGISGHNAAALDSDGKQSWERNHEWWMRQVVLLMGVERLALTGETTNACRWSTTGGSKVAKVHMKLKYTDVFCKKYSRLGKSPGILPICRRSQG
jgi:hypothetical protein